MKLEGQTSQIWSWTWISRNLTIIFTNIACGCISLICFHLHMAFTFVCLSSPLLSLIRTCVIGFKAYPGNSGWSSPSLQSTLCWEGPGESGLWEQSRVALPAFIPKCRLFILTSLHGKLERNALTSLFSKDSISAFIYNIKNKFLISPYFYSCLF